MKPIINTYLLSIRSYKKNKFVPIEDSMVKRIQTEWGFIFEEYGYDLEYKDTTATENLKIWELLRELR